MIIQALLCNDLDKFIQLLKYNQIMSLFGVELNHQINRLINQIRLQLNKHKLLPNIRTLYRSFAKYDTQVTGLVSVASFQKALGQNGLFFKKHQLQIFQKGYANANGNLNWFQFLQHVKIPMNNKRRELIENIYFSINRQYESVTPQNLLKRFNPQGIQIYDTKKVSRQYIQQQLISILSIPNGVVTQEEFIAFYDDLNANYPHDEPFAKYVSQNWGYQIPKTSQITQQALRQIIKAFRFKLIQKSKGTNDEFLLKKLFSEFDQNKNGYISAYQLDLLLKKLQLPIRQQAVQPLFRTLDKNRSGSIQYDEFKAFLFFDPYPV